METNKNKQIDKKRKSNFLNVHFHKKTYLFFKKNL